MADSDLEAIRRARLQQLQAQQGQNGGGGGGSGGGGEGGSREDEQQSREAEARASILSQILEPAAADRLGRIRMVNATRAEEVENRLIMLARSGQLRARVSENQLKDLLNAVSEQRKQQELEEVKVKRRGGGSSWDDDDLDDLLAED